MNSSYLINFFHTCFRGLEEFNPRRKRHFRRHKTSSATAMEVLESRQLLSGTNADLTPVSSFDLIVDTNVDESDGDFSAGDLSLREAIEMANQISANNPEQVRIGFASALRGDTILLKGSQLEITGDVGLTGFGDADLTINANGQSRAFYISGEAIADLEGLTITGGLQQLTEAASGTDHLGGAIFNQGILRVTESVIFGNQAYEGGAIYSEGTTTVELSVLKENRAAGNGGAISGDDGLVVISESTLENNSSENNGGAIFLWSADLQVESSLLTQNSATIGGAISARANHGNEFYLINSTLVENEASFSGGGVYSFTDTYITNSTISGNRVLKQTNGGGGGVVIRYYDNSSHGTLTLHNSIVAGNYQDDQGELSGSEIEIDYNTTVGNVVSGTNNIIGDAGTSESLTHGVNGNIVGNNGVGTLAIGSVLFDADSDGLITHRDLLDHTGPTKSLALGRSSLAIDAGDNSQAKDASGVTLLNDQRGQQRVREGNLDQVETVDIGAYEMATPIIVNTLEDTVIVDEFTSLREAITAAHLIGGDNVIDFADSLNGGTITLDNSEIGIGSNIFIRGLGRDNLTIDANDMSQHFVNNGASVSTIADVRLTGGNDVQTDFGLGGSIENDGILNIAGVKFDNNYSRYRGGAIYNHDGSDLTILNTNFVENTSNYQGGSIANHGVTTIYSSLFEGNTAPYQGGAIYNYHYFPVRDFDGQVAILDSQFISNQAIDRQGGALYSAGGVVSIDGSDFIDNFAPQDSGAISALYTQLSIRNSLFEGNETTGFHAGAVLAASTDNILISHSTFRDNHAAGFGGGVYIINGFNHLIEYSTFEGNSAGTGGGLMLLGSGVVRNSMFTNNTSRQDGGGIVFSHPNSGNVRQYLINSTVSGNTAGWSGGGVWLSRGNYLTLTNSTVTQNHAEGSGGGGVNVHTGTVEINNSIVAGNTLGSERVMKDLGNNGHLDFINYIGQHSLFGDTDSANYFTDSVDGNRIGIDVDTVLDSELKDNGGLIKTHALLEDSLAINAGNNALALDASMNALTTDQRGSGFDRIIGDRVDIGAYESTSMTGGGPTTRIDITPSSLGYGIPGQDNAIGAGFVLYSQQSVQQRFAGAVVANGAEHFVAVRYINSQ
ncbi:choice-of-anchor Q domain-containing protein, partial [uncultured Rubinisphaera sp.]|uniref:choice-of-anchor Q domain-containing protein n=1 Tax=uncultured Rubinisphaera sp. TaxID=1678686 RepID=UPI0030D82DD0